jgi:Histidine kinase-, DNA gyrase B-, and HSP90-like ATPase
MNESIATVDLTPTPKILRTLGEIPFQTWQCFAELMDNSIDEFQKRRDEIKDARIDISWSSEAVSGKDREIVITDNGLGMSLDSLQKAAKAGWSSNDPVGHLGLFGMGFNISTARLGDETLFLSATKESEEWTGIQISFDALIREKTFHAPVVRVKKESNNENGTKIIIRKLNDGVYNDLKTKERSIRQRLETIYAYILNNSKLKVILQGRQLAPKKPCVWGKTRFVMRGSEKVYAVKEIERDLGDAFFDSERNRYLSDDEAAELQINVSNGIPAPKCVSSRPRRLRGWIGIQRFCDTSDFGIDFIRNGRKILVGDKRLFEFENPGTGKKEAEYPTDLGTTVGGRIIGELQVDFLIPTYQKNDFITNDRSWNLTVEALRGGGPIRLKKRQALGYDEPNASPLGLLVNAYARAVSGTKHLMAPNSIAREYRERYDRGDLEYQSDDKWFLAAQESDLQSAGEVSQTTPVASGAASSDNADSYVTNSPTLSVTVENLSHSTLPSNPPTTPRDTLLSNSEADVTLTDSFTYSPTVHGFQVSSRRIKQGDIKINGTKVPCNIFADGVEIDFIYDPAHPILQEYNITAKQLLLQCLAERFSTRDQGISLQTAFFGLIENHLQDERLNPSILLERARSIWDVISDSLPRLFADKAQDVVDTVCEVPFDKERFVSSLMDQPTNSLLDSFTSKNKDLFMTLSFVPKSSVLRIFSKYPSDILDNKLFCYPYDNIPIDDVDMKARIKKQNIEKLISYLKDVVSLLEGDNKNRNEILRLASTLRILEGKLV